MTASTARARSQPAMNGSSASGGTSNAVISVTASVVCSIALPLLVDPRPATVPEAARPMSVRVVRVDHGVALAPSDQPPVDRQGHRTGDDQGGGERRVEPDVRSAAPARPG